MKNFKILLVGLALSTMLCSCYTYTTVVGKGAQSGLETRKMNHYLIYGLAPVATADAKEMAKGATDYEVTTKITFIDGLINALTLGIYTPTTTIVKR